MPYSVKKVRGNKRENYTKRSVTHANSYSLQWYLWSHLPSSTASYSIIHRGNKTDYLWADKDWNYLPQDEETRIQVKPMHFLLFPFSSHKTISDIARRKTWSFEDVLAFLLKPITGGFVCYRRIFLNQCVGEHPYLSAQFIKEIKKQHRFRKLRCVTYQTRWK